MLPLKRKHSEPSNVLQSLFELKVKGTLCDVQLHIQGSSILAHACVLASCSSYFQQLFNLNKAIHWCTRNPIVINLEEVLENSVDLCVICVSKILDFMYLRELVILQDHYEHFVAINNLFQVFDSMPLSKYCKKTNLPENLKIEQPTSMDVSSDVFLSKQLSSDKSKTFTSSKSVFDMTKFMSNVVVSSKASPKQYNKLSTKVFATVLKSTEPIPHKILQKKNSVDTVCEFICCNPEPDTTSSSAKLRKRRKMFCEMCDFSSVSIRKILQHLQSTEHFQSSCPICLRKVSIVNELKDHVKDHIDPKPFICQICNKRNRFWDYHKMHLKIHCRNKSFYCDLCQRGFVSKRSLKEHLTTHKGKYLCSNCDYFTSDINMYRSHLLDHEKGIPNHELSSQLHFNTDIQLKNKNDKKFQCQVCSEGFTQKKNLVRHVKLKHFDSTKYKCSMCPFASPRLDILSAHLKKKHGFTLLKENKCSIEKRLKKNSPQSSEFLSVAIPIQILTDECNMKSSISTSSERVIVNIDNSKDQPFSSTHALLEKTSKVNLGGPKENECKVDDRLTDNQLNSSNNNLQDMNICAVQSAESDMLQKDTDTAIKGNILSPDNVNVQSNFISMSHSISVNVQPTENKTQTFNCADIKENITIDKKEAMLDGSQYIWLNETTGELLNVEHFVNLQTQKNISKTNLVVPGTETLPFELCDQLKSSINEASVECSTLDFLDENEEWQLPQTPQTNVVGIDDCDTLFHWNQIDNSFYSTWVLNETTGELNMVSFFSIQSVRNPSELEMGENMKTPKSNEDDDTALFLNEGTGDLSVIYFKPDGLGSNDSNTNLCENISCDNLETQSDISDDDFLNEEFMRVSANFMSNEENEKFLNELTGEFDSINLKNYQCEIVNHEISEKQSYLNEETGEISWNIMDKSVDNGIFTKHNSLDYDVDDSLNCDDFEPFLRDMNGFSSQFCLEECPKNWQPTDDGSDALMLNECTGELVKRI